jgi:hypothetical protein
MGAGIEQGPVPYTSVGSRAFEAEHQWPTLLSDEEAEGAFDGIQSDFDSCLEDAASIAARLLDVLESVAGGHCMGCRNVACRIAMLIEDLEVQDRLHGYERRQAG